MLYVNYSTTPTIPLTLSPKTFKAAFCEQYGCSPERYASRVFWRCLYWHAIPFALVLRLLFPRFFQEDFILIKDLERATDMGTIRAEVGNFSSINRMSNHTFRNQFQLRLSGKKVMKLASAVFAAMAETGVSSK